MWDDGVCVCVLLCPSRGWFLCRGVLLTSHVGSEWHTQQNGQIKWDSDENTHTFAQGLQWTFPTCVYSHKCTSPVITWIAAYPLFIKCFQGECQASGMPFSCLCLCVYSADRHRSSFPLSSCIFSMGCFFMAVWWSPSWMPQPKRSALPKATLKNKEGSNGAHGFDESPATAVEQIRAG